MTKIIYILSLFFLLNASAQNPDPPVWANQWQASFSEDVKKKEIMDGHSQGTLYYDWTNKLFRVDRENGEVDKFCGSIIADEKTPCSHIVYNDVRYLYFPDHALCCACCTSADGCGIVKPDWLSSSAYGGRREVGTEIVDEWSLEGTPEVLYYQLVKGAPVLIYNIPNDLMVFNTSTYQTSISDPSVFELPDICKNNQKCPASSACGAFGKELLIE